MSKEKYRRAELLEAKIRELENYSRRCPRQKVTIVQKLIAHYERILDNLVSHNSLITI